MNFSFVKNAVLVLLLMIVLITIGAPVVIGGPITGSGEDPFPPQPIDPMPQSPGTVFCMEFMGQIYCVYGN